MDQLVHDFNTALDETGGSNSSSRSSASRRKVSPHIAFLSSHPISLPTTVHVQAWKRRCKSTSNLTFGTGNNISDDSSSSVDNVGLLSRDRGTSSLQFSDSDLDTPAYPGLARTGRNRTKRGRGDPLGIESDSFTENVQPWQDFRVHSKRRRKFKRMAIAPGVDVRGATATKRKKVRSRSGYDGRTNTRMSATSSCTPGKRKRSTREKSVESGDILGGGSRSRTVSLSEDKMEMEEEEESSSSLSSSEWEDVNDGCGSPEGEADDEQSDWPGHDPGHTDEELDPEISFSSRKLVGPGKGRVMRAGSRRLKSTNRSPPYGEMLQRFLQVERPCCHLPRPASLPVFQDSSMQSLRLKNVKSSERNMILSLARLYNLSVTVEANTLILSKLLARQARSETDHGGPGPEFAVPGVPQQRQYRDKEDRTKKQRKHGPILEASSIVTRQQHSAGSRHRNALI